MACVYPDASTPSELWENVLAKRRAFRRMPAERLRLEDYFSADKSAPDATYASEAAVIEGYEFDRLAFRVPGSTFRTADLAHWLALDVAAQALSDAGFGNGQGLPRETTGVLLGNTLTGEFSRASTLRLRWPFVRRMLSAALEKESWAADQRERFLARLENQYKSPFPPVGEETLAGGLSNTIAGRICNQFKLNGGGYTVDGACASSLLAVANACSLLTAGDLNAAIVGGVDLSLDPFEMVGFAKTGALASSEMLVFDQNSAGFWPGEGCGVVVLMRHDDALAQGRRVYAVIRGWGISSDGAGAITRPEADGQLLALRRAYRRAGFGIETVSYCECHGMGTAVGDATELEALGRARREAEATSPPAAIGSIKANIGHAKAAAGIAGLLKATMAIHTQVLPPTTGCEEPHAQLADPSATLRILQEPEVWPSDHPLRASVSAMGFGGINVHVVLQNVDAPRRAGLSPREHALARSAQGAEAFLFAAQSLSLLEAHVAKLRSIAAWISRAEMCDLAAALAQDAGGGWARAGVVASKPCELAGKLKLLEEWLRNGLESRLDFSTGVFLGKIDRRPRISFLFPGQGSPTNLDCGLWRRRFESVRELYSRAGLPADGDTVSTRVMQPAIVAASLAGLKVLGKLGINADAAVGHSLGEIVALHWAGAFGEETLLRISKLRGAAMAALGSRTGAMLAVAAPWEQVQDVLRDKALTIVGYNSPLQTVIAGDVAAVNRFSPLAAARGWRTSQLPVSHAFHTPLVASAVPVVAEHLEREQFVCPRHKVFSTITGAQLGYGEDLRELLCRQITSPVRFTGALRQMLDEVRPDLLIEVGPGAVLTGLTRETTHLPVISLDAAGNSLEGPLQAASAVFALGGEVQTSALFADRFTRPFSLNRKPKFFSNPCELAPATETVTDRLQGHQDERAESVPPKVEPSTGAALALFRQLVADRAELPLSSVREDSECRPTCTLTQ
jgi:enediyne polyketide synthase